MRANLWLSAVALTHESGMHKLVAHIILPTRFSTSELDIYHGGRCICIISALTRQICQLGKPLGAPVVRKPKQITLLLTPRVAHQGNTKGTPRHTKSHHHSATPREHQGWHTKAPTQSATKRHRTTQYAHPATLEDADRCISFLCIIVVHKCQDT